MLLEALHRITFHCARSQACHLAPHILHHHSKVPWHATFPGSLRHFRARKYKSAHAFHSENSECFSRFAFQCANRSQPTHGHTAASLQACFSSTSRASSGHSSLPNSASITSRSYALHDNKAISKKFSQETKNFCVSRPQCDFHLPKSDSAARLIEPTSITFGAAERPKLNAFSSATTSKKSLLHPLLPI